MTNKTIGRLTQLGYFNKLDNLINQELNKINMTTTNIIKGLTILNKYCEKDSYKIYAEHDEIFFDVTDKKIENSDLEELVKLGWFQPDAEYEEEFTLFSYDPDLGWKSDEGRRRDQARHRCDCWYCSRRANKEVNNDK